MRRSFKRSFASLQEVFSCIEEFFAAERIDRRQLFPVEFAVEELFTNMVKYNAGNAHDIEVDLTRAGDRLEVRLTEFDVDRFDLNAAPAVRTDRPLAERQPGGLGIHLLKKMVDRVDYEYADRRSTTTLIKKLE